MCAILGYVGPCPRWRWPATYRILCRLFTHSQVRGTDATGFAAVPVNRRRHRQIVWRKRPVPAALFTVSTPQWLSLPPSGMVLGHCRAATHGAADTGDDRNNHPFLSDDGTVAVAHNGVIPNNRTVALRHRLTLRSECDSEVLVRLIDRYDDAPTALRMSLRECSGSLAVAVLDRRRRTMWLATNGGRPLVLARLKRHDGWFIASNTDILLRSLGDGNGASPERRVEVLLPIPSGVVIGVTQTGRVIESTCDDTLRPPMAAYSLMRNDP